MRAFGIEYWTQILISVKIGIELSPHCKSFLYLAQKYIIKSTCPLLTAYMTHLFPQSVYIPEKILNKFLAITLGFN